jgi:hypothetical protein
LIAFCNRLHPDITDAASSGAKRSGRRRVSDCKRRISASWREIFGAKIIRAKNNFQIASPYYYGQNLRGLSYRFIRIATDGDPVVDAASVVSDCTRMRKNPQHWEISTSAALIDRVFSIGR